MRLFIISIFSILAALLPLFDVDYPPSITIQHVLLFFGSIFLLEALYSIQLKSRDEKQPDSSRTDLISFLALLQKKGRFIDFLMEDISDYDDAQVAAATRIVHRGCSSLLGEHIEITPIDVHPEGTEVSLESNHEPGKVRLIGKVPSQPPFVGKIVHRGWQASKISLPTAIDKAARDAQSVIAPAEIELS